MPFCFHSTPRLVILFLLLSFHLHAHSKSTTFDFVFRLFDGSCEPCNCSDECDTRYQTCVDYCEQNCGEEIVCNECMQSCRKSVLSTTECTQCNCTGSCQSETVTSNSSVVFDVSSYPCVTGKCGNNGRCVFMVSGGIVYSTCVCSNNYRGKLLVVFSRNRFLVFIIYDSFILSLN